MEIALVWLLLLGGSRLIVGLLSGETVTFEVGLAGLLCGVGVGVFLNRRGALAASRWQR